MDDLVRSKKGMQEEIERLNARIAELEQKQTNNEIYEKLKLSEERLRQITENTKEWIWEIDLNGKYTFASNAVNEMFGYQVDEVVDKKYFYEWFCPEKQEQLKEEYNQLFNEEKSFTNLIGCCEDREGELVWISASGVPMYDANKKLIGYRGSAINITEQKNAEDKLNKSKEKFSKGFLTSPDSISVTRLSDGCFESVNNRYTEMFGYTSKEVVGKTSFELGIWVEQEDREKIVSIVREKGTVKNMPVYFRAKNGEIKEYSLSASIIDIDNIPHLLSMTRDISDLLYAQKLIRENEQRLSLHINQTPLGVIEGDLDYKVAEWNPSAERIFGYSKEEAMGQEAGFILSDNDMELVDEIMGSLKTFEGGDRSTNENVRKDGKVILCEWYNTPLVNKKGEVVAFASLVQDVTVRHRAKQVQNVLYNISNAAHSNDNLYKLLSFVRKELGKIIDTKNFYIALYNEDNETLTLPFFADERDKFTEIPAGNTLTKYVIDSKKSLLANKSLFRELEKQGKVESVGAQSSIWLGVPLKVEGNIIGVLAVQSYTDENAFTSSDMQMLEFVSDQISVSIQRKKNEEELIKALKKAEESDRLKTAFLQNMSHEIRTPMNGILGFTALLKEPDLGINEKNQYISIIEKSGDRMLNTINDLMNISKIEAGQMEVINTEIDLNELVSYFQSFFLPEAEQKGLELRPEIEALETDLAFYTDKEKLYAIFTNLVKNAIKYTHEGSVIFGYKQIKDQLEFFVQDSGIGIPQNKIKKIFDRFVQVHEGLTSNYEGTGLGLSITKAYVELLGGKISLESIYGKGSIFRFTLPFQNSAKPKAEVPIVTESKSKSKNNGIKILIAEDDESIKTYLSIVVRKVSNDVIFAQNGLDAVEACKQNPDLDLVLMDIKMPHMDGYEATTRIREFNKDVVIIAQTAFAFESEREKALDAGCNEHITKPINRKALTEIIGKFF